MWPEQRRVWHRLHRQRKAPAPPPRAAGFCATSDGSGCSGRRWARRRRHQRTAAARWSFSTAAAAAAARAVQAAAGSSPASWPATASLRRQPQAPPTCAHGCSGSGASAGRRRRRGRKRGWRSRRGRSASGGGQPSTGWGLPPLPLTAINERCAAAVACVPAALLRPARCPRLKQHPVLHNLRATNQIATTQTQPGSDSAEQGGSRDKGRSCGPARRGT